MGTLKEKLEYIAETKDAIKDAIEAKGVTVASTATFRSYADSIEEIEISTDIIPIQMFTDNNTTTSTYTINLEAGYYLFSIIKASANEESYTITISGNNSLLYSYQNDLIYQIDEASTVTIVYTPWNQFPSVDKLVCIFKIEGYTNFTAYYQDELYDGGITYDLANLANGDYIIIAQGNSVYNTGYDRAKVEYPYSDGSNSGIQYLGEKDLRYWKSSNRFKALRVILYHAASNQYRSSIYAYGQAAGYGVIQAIAVS